MTARYTTISGDLLDPAIWDGGTTIPNQGTPEDVEILHDCTLADAFTVANCKITVSVTLDGITETHASLHITGNLTLEGTLTQIKYTDIEIDGSATINDVNAAAFVFAYGDNCSVTIHGNLTDNGTDFLDYGDTFVWLSYDTGNTGPVTIVIDVDYLGYRALLGYDDEGADNPGSVTLTARTITTKRLLDWVMAPENDVTITAESITLSQRLLDVRIGPG